MTFVFACFLKKRANMPKNNSFFQNFWKFSESVRTHPNASRCIRMHPNASECIRTGPNRSEQVRKLQKTCENLEIIITSVREHFRENLAIFSWLSQVFEVSDLLGPLRTCSDALGCIRMRSDASTCVRMRSDTSGKFWKIW